MYIYAFLCLFSRCRNPGAPGWLGWLTLRLWLRSWSPILWVQVLCWALCWQLRAWSLLWILYIPLSAPPPLALARARALSLSPLLSLSKLNKHLKNRCVNPEMSWRGVITPRYNLRPMRNESSICLSGKISWFISPTALTCSYTHHLKSFLPSWFCFLIPSPYFQKSYSNPYQRFHIWGNPK